MRQLSKNEIKEVSGGVVGRMISFLAKSALGGAAWDGMKAAAGKLEGVSHNATNPMSATNRL